MRENHPRKQAGVSSAPPVAADTPKVVWALDFHSAVDGKEVRIASMVDEHTRESLLHFVERCSITANASSVRSSKCPLFVVHREC